VGAIERFEAEFLARRGHRALHRSIEIAEAGVVLGAGTMAFRIFLADGLMAAGYSPRDLCKALGFDLPVGLKKYSPDQPRDERGRWTSTSLYSAQNFGQNVLDILKKIHYGYK
jgi:hypothetical protein